MAVLANDIPIILVERIESAHPAPAVFTADEIGEWPDEALPALLKIGAMRPAGRANSISCPGCERQCYKPVVVRRISGSTEKSAHIACDESPALGRVNVPIKMVEQYQTALQSLAAVLFQRLGFVGSMAARTRNLYELGTVRGRYGRRKVSLALEDGQLLIWVGDQCVELSALLQSGAQGFSVDLAHIKRLANRKDRRLAAGQPTQPRRSRQRERTRKKQKRDKEILKEAKRLRKEGVATWTATAAIIAKSKLAKDENRRLEPSSIRRIISKRLKFEQEISRSKRARRN